MKEVKRMTIKQLKEIIKNIPDDANVQSHFMVDSIGCYLDEEIDVVNYTYEELQSLDGGKTFTLECER
jgi:hypothetical protein